MARKIRGPAAYLEKELLEKGSSFSFFQAIRLLNCILCSKGSGFPKNTDVKADRIRISPNLSLGFPANAIDRINKDKKTGKYHLIANILGLYGTGSPLPTFYTEELIDDVSNRDNRSRDFLDVINQRLYELLFAGWSKYRSMQKIFEEKSTTDSDMFFSLMGLGENELRQGIDDVYGLLRYTGLFAMGPRSASGLETILKDAFDDIEITVFQGIEHKSHIPEDQRAELGKNTQIGINTLLGDIYTEHVNAFSIEVGPVTEVNYRKFFPGEDNHNKLVLLTGLYVSQPFEYKLDIILDKKENPDTTQPGGSKWSGLGLDTWVFSDQRPEEYRVCFYHDIGFEKG